ncbi:hypothetical protein Pelo_4301 [Pelomyxa schiedti]|nr:hypothetical protein Pelo_4301 [Pelomyxa schiedti]
MANVWSESFILVAQGSSLISLDINTGVAVQCFERLGEPHTPTAVISSGTTTQGSVGSIKTGPAQQTNSIVAVRTLSDFVIALQQDGKLLVWNRKDPKCLQVLTPNRPAVQPPNTETVLTHPDLSSTAPTTTNQLQSPQTTQTPTPTPTNPNSHRNRPLHTFVVAETAGLVCTNPVTIWASVGEGSTTLLIWQ